MTVARRPKTGYRGPAVRPTGHLVGIAFHAVEILAARRGLHPITPNRRSRNRMKEGGFALDRDAPASSRRDRVDLNCQLGNAAGIHDVGRGWCRVPLWRSTSRRGPLGEEIDVDASTRSVRAHPLRCAASRTKVVGEIARRRTKMV